MQGIDISLADKKSRVIALGAFDGVHVAHTAVLKAAVNEAKSREAMPCVFTFYKDPSHFLGHPQKSLCSFSDREQRIKETGIEEIVYADFDLKMSQTEAYDFCVLLKEKLSPVCIVCGHNYTFGKNGSGDKKLLSSFCEKEGIALLVLDKISIDEAPVSSSYIRKLIENGDIALANKLLGYEYTLCGRVQKGNRLGSKLSFPTANISVDTEFAVPAYGVYVCRIFTSDGVHNAITNIGVKPTVGTDVPLAETHIFGVDKELYGEEIKVSLLKFIREERKFSDINALREAVLADIDAAKDYFHE